MFVTHEREKLINAIIYFVRNTKRCHKLKLFKLLSFLDFEHYRQTGRSITGLRYDAWPKGPVPSELDREIEKPKADLAAAVAIFKARDSQRFGRTIDDFERYQEDASLPERVPSAIERVEFKPKKSFNPKFFTKREMRIMETLAEIFRDAKGDDMIEVSHLKQLPWRQIYGRGEGRGHPIPYDLALASEPILKDMPTIDPDELAYRKEALREVT